MKHNLSVVIIEDPVTEHQRVHVICRTCRRAGMAHIDRYEIAICDDLAALVRRKVSDAGAFLMLGCPHLVGHDFKAIAKASTERISSK